jgi:peptidoglycan/LPS O-acetylase OafA/YrhL
MIIVKPESTKLNKMSSAYLEVIRIVSASYVFIFHVGSVSVGSALVFSTPQYGKSLRLSDYAAHFFVIVFFVLSGFLITMSASRPGLNFKTFLIARLGRLYSVLIPSLIFSYLVYAFLVFCKNVPPGQLEGSGHLLIRFFLNLSFLTQSWSLCSTPPLNTPFWSVNYEFVYYLLMGSLLLIRSNYKIVFFIIVAVIAGPKVLILFPAWLVGSLLYYCSQRRLISPKISGIIFVITSVTIIFSILNPEQFPLIKSTGDVRLWGANLLFSWNYQADYLFSILIALNIYSFFGISKLLLDFFLNKGFEKVFNFIKTIGDCTYTLYLFHLPLLFFFAFIFPYNKNTSLNQFGLILSVIITAYFIARFTEWKVLFWRDLVAGVFNLTFFKKQKK